ncbi:MAG: helix-turn-helix domain-containing protein [Spirochaetes bacterium]|nr:helix-turn-helix domain-containing protein [Spirochaetota bacterium]
MKPALPPPRLGKRTILYHREFRQAFPIHVQAQEQGESAFEHDHNFFEWVYVKRGQGLHRFRGSQTAIFAGDFWVIPRGERHAYLSGSRLEIVNVYIHPDLFDWLPRPLAGLEPGSRLFPETGAKAFPLRANFRQDRRARLEATLAALGGEASAHGSGYETKLLGLFLSLTADLHRFLADRTAVAVDARGGQDDPVGRTIAYLEAHLASPIKLGELAERIPMDASRFSRVFRLRTGMRPSEYLQKSRVDQACAFLREGSRPIAWIARDCGFQDQGHFARVFKKETGSTPRAFRDAHKASQ